MAFRDLKLHGASLLGLTHDPSLGRGRPMPTNTLAVIGCLPTFAVRFAWSEAILSLLGSNSVNAPPSAALFGLACLRKCLIDRHSGE